MYLAGLTWFVEVVVGLLLSWILWPNLCEVKSCLLSPLIGGGGADGRMTGTSGRCDFNDVKDASHELGTITPDAKIFKESSREKEKKQEENLHAMNTDC